MLFFVQVGDLAGAVLQSGGELPGSIFELFRAVGDLAGAAVEFSGAVSQLR